MTYFFTEFLNLKMKKLKFCIITLLIAFSAVFSGCGQSLNSNFYNVPAKDKYYFLALKKQQEGNNFEAKRLFSVSAKKSSSYIARLSAEKLTEIGNVRERLEACENLIKKYSDEDALLIAVKQLFAEEEFTKIVVLTNNINYETSENSLIYLRFAAMLKNNAPRLYNDVFEWFTKRQSRN